MQRQQGQGNAEVNQYIENLENQVRALRQVMKIGDAIAQQYAASVDALNAADRVMQIADAIAQRYAASVDALNAADTAMQCADALINYTYPRSEALEPVAQVADMADSLVNQFANILLNPDECASWYLELDPPRQPLVQTQAVPAAFARPSFPATPAPGNQGNSRDQFRAAWQHNPAQAWRALDQMAGQDLTNLFGV